VSGDDLFAVVVRPRRCVLARLGRLSSVVETAHKLVFALRGLARHGRPPALEHALRTTADDALSALRATLVAPLALGADEPVVMAPVTPLWRLPWSALHDAPVSVAPSAASWSRAARQRPSGRGVVLVAGPGLPGASAEVAALAPIHPGSSVLASPASTPRAVAAALPDTSLAHLACHGRLRADNPTFSSFLLCEGELTIYELTEQRAAPYRLVLSACDLGADVAVPGEELLGVVTALLARGSAGVLASCFPVPDEAAVPLMRAVHTRIRQGDSLAEALHHARRTTGHDDGPSLATAYGFTACGAA
jgi:hypothetical protein